ncbi:MAG TPA: hypothetical protein DCE00_00600 [Firmicutes bacterium]|nr:DUF188 domain-containing protein [Bacillota bacterium]HAA37349.1 hypothetical protein [Bacillota bacterium]
MKIIIDADACPKSVLQICQAVGRQQQVQVWTVASFNHRIISDRHFVVGNAAQETDIKVLNLAHKGDVVITQDWGLAAILLAKGVYCLSPMGKEYRQETIDFLLETREALAKIRRAGGRTKGPKKRTAADDERFRAALQRLMEKKDITCRCRR